MTYILLPKKDLPVAEFCLAHPRYAALLMPY